MFSYFNNIHNYLYFFSEIKYRIFYIIISLLITFIVSYLYKEQLIYLLTHYLLYNMASHRFIFTKLTQILLTYIKFSIILSFFINVPFILLHALYFFITALYKHEFIVWLNLIFFSIFFYILSIFITYYYIYPNILNIFLNFEKYNFFFPLHFEAKIEEFIFTTCFLFFNLIFCFQIPIILSILLYYKYINLEKIVKNRKIIYFIFLILSAIITPPDFLSQFFIYLLIIILFELFILFNYFKFNI